MKNLLFIGIIAFIAISCTSVESGNVGVKVEWGGETDMKQVYPEGLYSGLSWMFDDMVQYDVREKTSVYNLSFNDKNDMNTDVQISIDWRLMPNKVNSFHKEIDNLEQKLTNAVSAAAKVVVPQYGAVDLNKSKRDEADEKLEQILAAELPLYYVDFKRVRITDIDLPSGISQLAEQTAVQIGKNQLAEQKEAEQVALAKALVAEAQGRYDAELLNDKTKAIQSKPQYIELFKAQTERIWAEKGTSPYGANNVFGDGFLKTIK